MKRFAIGIDLGGTVIKIGLVQNHQIIREIKIDALSQDGIKPRLSIIEEKIDQLMMQYGITPSQLIGVGLAFPGLVDSKSKKILSTNKKYDDAPCIDFQDWVRQKWKTPFFIDNDARMAAVGEWKFGAGKGYDNLVAVTFGTGIGSSAIIEGKLLRGKHFQAGVLGGHISLNYKGNICTCGNIGCAEAEASTWNIARKIKEDPLFVTSSLAQVQKRDFEALFKAAQEKDELAVKVRDECIHIWSAMIINLIHAYDPEMVVMCGGVLNSREMILPHIEKAIHAYAWCPWGKVKVTVSELHHKAAILGVTYCLEHEL